MIKGMNRGIDIAREQAEQDGSEWVFGALSQPCLASIPEADRVDYLPLGEVQYGAEDFQDCASRAPVNILEAKFTYLYKNNKLSSLNDEWLEKMGFIEDGRVTFSDRFVAINSGTTRQGNSLKAPLEAIRKQGLIPKKMLPREASMTWAQYHDKSKITQEMRDIGESFAERFTINYEQVYEQHYGEALKDDMLDTAGYAWPTPENGVYPRVDHRENHAFVLYKTPKFQAFDNYEESPGDFTKNLAPDYNFFDYCYRPYISSQQLDSQTKSVLTQLQDLLSSLMKQLQDYLSTTVSPPQTDSKLNLQKFCLGIKVHEGWFVGSRSYRNNNPGNARYSSVGYLPIYGEVKRDAQNFAIFKDYATGYLYLQNLVKDKVKKNPDWDFYDFFNNYAPDSDGNDSKNYAKVVAGKLSVPPNTILSTLL